MYNIKKLITKYCKSEGHTPQGSEDKNGHLNKGAIRRSLWLPGSRRPGDIAKT